MSTPHDKPDTENPGKRVNASGARSTPSQTQQFEHTGNSGDAQCKRLLQRLRMGPVTTFEAMRSHDIYHCPARVLQLRKRGHNIATVWDRVITEAGVAHRVGKYVLIREAV